jgi:hypothetical protein
MAQAEVKQESSHRRQNRFLVMLLLGAFVVSAAKDLSRLHAFTSGVVGLAASLQQKVLAEVRSPATPSCPQTLAENDRSGQPYNWNGRVAPDQLIEMSGSNGGIDAAPAVGGSLDLVAMNNHSQSEPTTASIQIARRVKAVASHELHGMEFSGRRDNGEAGGKRSANQLVNIRVRNHDLRFKFTVRVPAAVKFVGGMIDDEIKVSSPGSIRRSIEVCPLGIPRVDSQYVNGRINISTGYAQAKMGTMILSREINARLARSTCTEGIEFKAAERTICLDLLQILRARLAAETFNDETVSDFPRALKVMIPRTMSAAPAVAEDTH